MYIYGCIYGIVDKFENSQNKSLHERIIFTMIFIWTRMTCKTGTDFVGIPKVLIRNPINNRSGWCQQHDIINSLSPGDLMKILKIKLPRAMFPNNSLKLFIEGVLQELANISLTLAQFMAGCLTAPSHNLSRYWPRPVSPYGVTRAQWVNSCSGPVCSRIHRSLGYEHPRMFCRLE